MRASQQVVKIINDKQFITEIIMCNTPFGVKVTMIDDEDYCCEIYNNEKWHDMPQNIQDDPEFDNQIKKAIKHELWKRSL